MTLFLRRSTNCAQLNDVLRVSPLEIALGSELPNITLAIVSMMYSIRDDVAAAAATANSDAKLYAVPFPGMGHQVRFQPK